jgi:hypothetical protein
MTPSKLMSWIYGTTSTLKSSDGTVGAITDEAFTPGGSAPIRTSERSIRSGSADQLEAHAGPHVRVFAELIDRGNCVVVQVINVYAYFGNESV